jgi:hypothetical protein
MNNTLMNKLHDATLLSINFDWTSGTGSIKMRIFDEEQKEVEIICKGFSNLKCTRTFPWGRSNSINEVKLANSDADQSLRVEIQSGDVINVTCESISTLQ